MKLTMVTWAGVKVAGPPPSCGEQTVTSELDGLLGEHVAQLLARIEGGSTPAAEFTGSDFRDRFSTLINGSATEFLSMASSLAVALQSKMDKRTGDGLLVAARLVNQTESLVGVFKLDITDRLAGFIDDSPTGSQVLHAVRNVLETPGKLQKGTVYPDPRTDSEVVVGDKLPDTALYFLDALGIRQVQRASQAPRGLIDAIAQVTSKPVDEIVVAVQTSSATTAPDILSSISDLQQRQRDEVLRRLEGLKRPIRQVDPASARKLRKVLKASGITIAAFPGT
jgi:hypothetical protein